MKPIDYADQYPPGTRFCEHGYIPASRAWHDREYAILARVACRLCTYTTAADLERAQDEEAQRRCRARKAWE